MRLMLHGKIKLNAAIDSTLTVGKSYLITLMLCFFEGRRKMGAALSDGLCLGREENSSW